jgi:hypothetical protein
MKKERKKFRRALELKWIFGNSAMVHGLKYNPMTNTFQLQLVYNVKISAGTLEEKEGINAVSEDWIKDANEGEGMDLGLQNKFVEVPLEDASSYTLERTLQCEICPSTDYVDS